MKSLIIFDLDGTLLDTLGDLTASTNYALEKCGFPIHEDTDYRFFVGNGINKLFERALPEGAKTAENISNIRTHFLEYYGKHSTELTVPYPGICNMVKVLQLRGVKIAIASNKYQAGTEKLTKHFFPDIYFVAVLGQREGIPVKPDPAIIHEIIKIADVNKNDVLYIGDSGVDMQTALNAGIDVAGVIWGFRPKSEIEAFDPNYIIESPYEILDI
jgi:phosphoglycolate phosphatase